MSKKIPAEGAKPGAEPEVSVEFLETLPKGTRIKKITLPSDEDRADSESRSNSARVHSQKKMEEKYSITDGLTSLDHPRDCSGDGKLLGQARDREGSVKGVIEGTVKRYWWLLVSVYAFAWIVEGFGISRVWTVGFFLAGLTLFCYLEFSVGGFGGLVKAAGWAILMYLALAVFLMLVQFLIPLIFGVMGLTSIAEAAASFGRP